MKYRKKPVVIEAFCWTGGGFKQKIQSGSLKQYLMGVKTVSELSKQVERLRNAIMAPYTDETQGKISKEMIEEFKQSLSDVLKNMSAEKAIYKLFGITSVNLLYYDPEERPIYVTLLDYVIACESAEEFNLTPGKKYLVEGVEMPDTLLIKNDLGVVDWYSVENFKNIAK